MKSRAGFVSNSSSSSFVISKHHLTELQIAMIKAHRIIISQMEDDCLDHHDAWNITEYEDRISGSTTMDNFNMREFLNEIGVPMEEVRWSE